MLVLIWVQTVCKGYQQMTKVTDSKERVMVQALFMMILLIFLDWLQSLKQFFINVPYHILVASLTLMALF